MNSSIYENVNLHFKVRIDDGVIVEKFTDIGENSIVEQNAYIGSDVIIQSNVRIRENAILLKNTFIQNNSIVENNDVIIKTPMSIDFYLDCLEYNQIPKSE